MTCLGIFGASLPNARAMRHFKSRENHKHSTPHRITVAKLVCLWGRDLISRYTDEDRRYTGVMGNRIDASKYIYMYTLHIFDTHAT